LADRFQNNIELSTTISILKFIQISGYGTLICNFLVRRTPQHPKLLNPPDLMNLQVHIAFRRYSAGIGIMKLQSMMICVSNIAKMGIKRNCLFQLVICKLVKRYSDSRLHLEINGPLDFL